LDEPNYATMVKHDLDNLLTTRLIHSPSGGSHMAFPHRYGTKKNGKLKICVDFQKFNVATKNSYPLPFNEKVLDMVASHKAYYFLDGFFNYH